MSEESSRKVWLWHSDAKTFEPYKDYYQMEIEEAYKEYLKDKTKDHVIIKGVIRFVDDLPQDYKIDFAKMEQINLKTNFARKVNREVFYKGNGHVWKFYDNAWNEYSPDLQTSLEKAYEKYLNNLGSEKFQFSLPSRANEIYEIDFRQKVQVNLKTNCNRIIKRDNA